MDVRTFAKKALFDGMIAPANSVRGLIEQNGNQPVLSYLLVTVNDVTISACIFKTIKGQLVGLKNGSPSKLGVVKKYIETATFDRLKTKDKAIISRVLMEEI